VGGERPREEGKGSVEHGRGEGAAEGRGIQDHPQPDPGPWAGQVGQKPRRPRHRHVCSCSEPPRGHLGDEGPL